MRFVYFIQSGPNGPVKIGVAENIAKRIATLQIGNPEPLTLMASVEGGFSLERSLHERFARGRIAFEWFRSDTPGLMETVEHILRHGELPRDAAPVDLQMRCETCRWVLAMPVQADRVLRRGLVDMPDLQAKTAKSGSNSGDGGNRTHATGPPSNRHGARA